jgi:hypothetical protein
MEKDLIACGDIYLDTDTDPKLNKGSDYILNTVITSDGRYGVAINYKGNEYITLAAQHDNNITLMGWCPDHARNRVILFTYSNDNSVISYYDIDTGNTGLILNNASYLNFNPSYLINNPKVVGDILEWTDGYNPPRKINYIRAYNYTNSIVTTYKYNTVNADVIEAYKKPGTAITPLGITGNTNIIRGKSYQWAYKYVYTDGEKSVLSQFTTIYFTDTQYYPNGEFKIDSGIIYYLLYFFYFSEDIISTELYVRDDEASDWYLYDVINKPSSITFSGTESGGKIIVSSDIFNSATIGAVVYNVGFDEEQAVINSKTTSGSNHLLGFDSPAPGGTTTYSFYDGISKGEIQYHFDDTKLRIKADQVDLGRPFDYIPLLAGQMELIEKNRIIYGDITEGFDPVDVEVDTSIVYVRTNTQDINSATPITPYYIAQAGGFFYLRFGNYPLDTLYGIQIMKIIYTSSFSATFSGHEITVTSAIYATLLIGNFLYSPNISTGVGRITNKYISGTNYIIVIDNLINGTGSITFSLGSTTYIDVRYVAKTGDTVTTILNDLANKLSLQTITSTVVTYLGTLNIRFTSNNTVIPASSIVMFTYALKSVYKTMKHLDSYLGAITYYDKDFRHGSENKFDNSIDVTQKLISSFTLGVAAPQYAYVNVSIKNQPPDWAYYYTIDFSERVHRGAYWQIAAVLFKDFFFGSDGLMRLKVNNIINYAHDVNPFLNFGTYNFDTGDRICIHAIGSFGAIFGSLYPLTMTSYPAVPDIDVEIKGVEWPESDLQYSKDFATTPAYLSDANGNKIKDDSASYIVVPITYAMLSSYNVFTNTAFLFEIYKPKKVSDNPLYFPNRMLEIGNPGTANRYHKGISQHQNPSNPAGVPAIVPCTPGDTYLKLRDCKYVFPCTDDNYSDYYTSNFYGNGFPNIFDANAKQVHLIGGLRYGGQLFENTKINELNRFEANNLVVLKSEFGTIRFIKEVGDELKVLQDKKENSIYVGKEEMTHPNGQVTLISSDKVLGNINRMDELRGTQHPRSAVVHNRNLYYWDGLRGEFIRSAPNGSFPISVYGMKTYFKNKTGYTDVIAGFDETNNMLLVTFIGGTSETIGFYDPDVEGVRPRWISFFSFIPSSYISSGTFFASFSADMNGLYKHNSDAVARCTYFENKYNQQINLNYNNNAAIKKLFKAIGLKSNKAWSIPTISIESDSSYPRGQLSKLNTNHFVLKEGDYFSDFLNNMLTTSNTPSNLDLVEGDKLRAFAMKLELVNREDGEVWLLACEIIYDPSNLF